MSPKLPDLGALRIQTLLVDDLRAAKEFYVDRLGFEVEREDKDFFMVRIGALSLCLDRATEEDPARGGGSNLIFQVGSLDETEAALAERAVEVKRSPSGGYLEVSDPEGYKLIFTENI